MSRYILLLFFFAVFLSCRINEKEPNLKDSVGSEEMTKEPNIFALKTNFPSKDDLIVTADIYEVNGLKPTVLLCHQAGYSRGEYKDTALRLNKLGYSCMAIDQRSGEIANDVKNETAQRASEKKLPTRYIDAKIDIESAIDYMYDENGNQPIILVGSSYSASLALLIGNSNPKVKAIASFSPGEYLEGINLSNEVKNYTKLVFVTSSQKEIGQVEELDIKMSSENMLIHFKPTMEGIHGSRALWESTKGNDKYWEAFASFLVKVEDFGD